MEDKGSSVGTCFNGEGVEFADALHLMSRPAGVAFASFDRAFVRRAQRAGAGDIMTADKSR